MPLRLHTMQESIARQREALKDMLREPLAQAAQTCSRAWGDRQKLNATLADALARLPVCKYIYALDTNAIQVSDNITREGMVEKDFGRDRSSRPYMNERVPSTGFLLSHAYISMRAKRPSLTAIQIVRDDSGRVLGFVGADFDLRDLPITGEMYEEPRYWQQIRGDPAIRGTVFHQTRSDSQMDQNIDTVLGVVEELMTERGVFHVILHFSSSRAVIWLFDDPYRYRLLDIDALIHPDTCLSYPRCPYPDNALVPKDRIRAVLDSLRDLNIFNGVVGLTFSCDGSHYLPWDEFLGKGSDFWANGDMIGETCPL
jgi:hypothetical protein